MTALIIILFLALLAIGLPLYIALFGISAYLFSTTDALPLISAVISFQKLDAQEFIVAIPLFTFSSFILAYSKSPQKIFNIFNKLFAHIRGADIGITLVLMTFFTALTGASGATILALGGLLYPLLIRGHKTPNFSLGLITSSGSIGLLMAPSLPVIIYSLIASQNMTGDIKPDINTLFKVGIIPTLLFVGTYFLYSFFSIKQISLRTFNKQEAKEAIIDGRYELFIPVIIYGGIYSGLFTVLEAATVSALYIFIYVFFIRKDMPLSKLIDVVIDSMKITGSIFVIMATAFMLTNYIIDQHISQKLFDFLSIYIPNKYVFLLFINCFLLFVGFIMDIYSAILVVLPILLPIVERYGINPYHFALIFLINLEIGYITPPVGMNLFIASHRFRKPIMTVYKTTVPFFFIMVFNLALITYIPEISTFLTNTDNSKVSKDFKLPAKITQVVASATTADSISISFDAVGNDNMEGTADSYIVYYSDFPIESKGDLDFAEVMPNPPKPKASGEKEVITLTGLSSKKTYYISIVARDNSKNQSEYSDPIEVTTK